MTAFLEHIITEAVYGQESFRTLTVYGQESFRTLTVYGQESFRTLLCTIKRSLKYHQILGRSWHKKTPVLFEVYRGHMMLLPPSMARVWPVMKDAPGLARNATVSATWKNKIFMTWCFKD